jgi:hypothetical protein
VQLSVQLVCATDVNDWFGGIASNMFSCDLSPQRQASRQPRLRQWGGNRIINQPTSFNFAEIYFRNALNQNSKTSSRRRPGPSQASAIAPMRPRDGQSALFADEGVQVLAWLGPGLRRDDDILSFFQRTAQRARQCLCLNAAEKLGY